MIDFLIGALCDHTVEGKIYTINTCPLCDTTGFRWKARENDIQYDALRKPFLLQSVIKLKQEIMKILLTRLGADSTNSQYGSELTSLIGKKAVGQIKTMIKTDVLNALAYYNVLNENNTNPAEMIETVDSITITNTDPRKYLVAITLITQSGETVSMSVPVGVS
jgi:phage baseplate assembly protein W